MHILFLSDNFPPEVNAPASRTFEHCREWVKSGHKVTVITCAPNFPKGKVFEGYSNRLWQSDEVEGIQVIRVWSYIARNEGFAKRILDYLSFMVSGFCAALFVRRVDFIIGTSPQFFTVCAAYAASVFKRRPWIFELRDIWPESIRAVGAMRKERLLDTLERLELFLYRKATVVVAVTNSFKHNLVDRGIDAAKIQVVTNGVDTSHFTPMQKDQNLLSDLGLNDAFVVGYIGTHGMAHGLNTIIDAAKILSDTATAQNVRIVMLGDGACRKDLEYRAKSLGLKNILFIDSVSKSEVARYWSILDASIIHLRKSDLFKTVIPSKMFECMGMGIPILHGVEGESADIVIKYDVGLTFEPENQVELAGQVMLLQANYRMRERFSLNGPEAARSYDRSALAGKMLQIVENFIK